MLVLVYAGVYSTLSILKHDTFHSYTFDLGIMSQVLWNTAHGHLFEVSLDRPLDTQIIGSYLGNHVRPILLLIAPVYRLWPDPRLLLSLQALTVALGAVPLFWIARRELRNPWSQISLVIAYLFYPALGYINLFDFHPIVFSIPLLILAYWALLKDRQALFWIAVLLSLATKEEMVVPIAAFAIYCSIHPRWRRTGLALLAVTVLWALVCFVIIIPHFNEGRPYRFIRLWSLPFQSLSPVAGGSKGQTVTLNLLSGETHVFLLHLLLPLAFLPLLGPRLLAVSLPSLAYLLLSNEPSLSHIGYQYPAVLVPWFFLATVAGVARLDRWLSSRRARGIRYLPSSLLLIGALVGGLPFSPILFHWTSGAFDTLPHRQQIQAALDQIPPQAGVATINSLGVHLPNRRYLISLDRYPLDRVDGHLRHMDYVLLDLVDCRAVTQREKRQAYSEMTLHILQTGQFGVRYWSDRIILLKRGISPAPELDQVRDYVELLDAEERPCWP